MSKTPKRTVKYLAMPLYVRANDAEYIREKLQREPETSDFVEALLEKCSKL